MYNSFDDKNGYQRKKHSKYKYNKQYLDALDADPGLFTAGLSDTIHFAVDYKNGVRQEFSVWITVQPDGQVMACLLGETGEI